jgi:hypothetical protein
MEKIDWIILAYAAISVFMIGWFVYTGQKRG